MYEYDYCGRLRWSTSLEVEQPEIERRGDALLLRTLLLRVCCGARRWCALVGGCRRGERCRALLERAAGAAILLPTAAAALRAALLLLLRCNTECKSYVKNCTLSRELLPISALRVSKSNRFPECARTDCSGLVKRRNNYSKTFRIH